jgi:hypothetical protein
VLRVAALASAGLLCLPPAAPAQARRGEFTLDVHWVGLSAGVAGAVQPKTLLGVEAGLGGDALNAMLWSGRHFSQSGFLAYETRDQYDGERLWEVLHISLLMRKRVSPTFQYDVGFRLAAFAHWDDSDDEPGGASFAGVYLNPMYGGSRFKVGPKILVGFFSEGRPELGVHVSLATGRLTFWW